MTFYDIGKRVFDILGSAVGILLFSPVMIITAVYIKVVSPKGPILADAPKRVGKNGKEFKFYKFRSMIPNAHKWFLEHPDVYKKYVENNYKLDPDPRWIKGAEFIRDYSIDELPQFFNIFLGQMSLVGPRSYYPFELKERAEKFPSTKKDIAQAIKVKPGLTGVWQISGRSEIGFVERVRMDAVYAQKKSLLYDLLILLKTPYVVLAKKGAK
ncbi:MAG: sugar transferase [Patescibacteria group bacterium]|jgi:lipopolysaccharide/colanic/teichoic acid biosynthesis glycosyltransferase